MADHPLRPAIHRSLGEPLPHQQANGTRAHPLAVASTRGHLFPQNPKTPWSYPVLAPVSRCCPKPKGRLPTRYSPVRRCTRSPKRTFSHDLHVLSTPPAFVLSQDQTLQFELGKANTSWLVRPRSPLHPPTPMPRMRVVFRWTRHRPDENQVRSHRTTSYSVFKEHPRPLEPVSGPSSFSYVRQQRTLLSAFTVGTVGALLPEQGEYY